MVPPPPIASTERICTTNNVPISCSCCTPEPSFRAMKNIAPFLPCEKKYFRLVTQRTVIEKILLTHIHTYIHTYIVVIGNWACDYHTERIVWTQPATVTSLSMYSAINQPRLGSSLPHSTDLQQITPHREYSSDLRLGFVNRSIMRTRLRFQSVFVSTTGPESSDTPPAAAAASPESSSLLSGPEGADDPPNAANRNARCLL